jgi:hypothetical protein
MADNTQSEGVKPTLREAVAKHAPGVVKDDPTNGEINPMVNDEPPLNVADIPF